MHSLLSKIVQISIYLALPLLCTSYIPIGKLNVTTGIPEPGDNINDGGYTVKVFGDRNLDLKGTTEFETVVETLADGRHLSTLKLSLKNDKSEPSHTLGFLISKENDSGQLHPGSYKISKNIDGFLNNFDVVFGFANIEVLGELPFFAERGQIIVFEIGKDNLRGNLNIALRNANGNRLIVKGNFKAVRSVMR